MDKALVRSENMVESSEAATRGSGGGVPSLAAAAVQQCELIQSMVDICLFSLQGLRTKCAASNDLTQQEIRTLEDKLRNYIFKQLQCKQKVPESERIPALKKYPKLRDWLQTVNIRKEVLKAAPEDLSLDVLLAMSESKVKETMKKYGATSGECCRLSTALSSLKSGNTSGEEIREDMILCEAADSRRGSTSTLNLEHSCPAGLLRAHYSPQLLKNVCSPRSASVSAVPSSDFVHTSHGPSVNTDNLSDPFPPAQCGRLGPKAAYAIGGTPPATPPAKVKNKLKPPARTPPPPSRKVFQLLPNFPALTRSKSHESQLGNRIDDAQPFKSGKKHKILANLSITGSGKICENIPTWPPFNRPVFPPSQGSSHFLSTAPSTVEYCVLQQNALKVPQGSPVMPRRDIGLSVTHRFATKSWLSQTCSVCHKNMMFGVKCKHCRLKCHNKCTKEAPPCRISFIPNPLPAPKIRRTESVPSDINNTVERLEGPQFGTLPKALTKKEPQPVVMQIDSSSNPSSTTSSTPSSPAPFPSSNPPSATPPPNPSPVGHRDNRFNFPDIQQPTTLAEKSEDSKTVDDAEPPETKEQDTETEEQDDGNKSESESETDEVDELPGKWCTSKGHISRMVSQTSVYLQEWDIPFEQVELGELIGKGRWGKVYKGKWHGEVAIRLLEIDGNNQDHLKLFKKEVMNYRQTRHENVVLFMGACMHPPHLAIITSFCKGRTLHSVVRDPQTAVDINKTRQIAQEVIKGMGYLHAKGIVHKDLKSKNIFCENGKVVITDFGLFGISGVVQEGRRENELRLPRGWLSYLAPEIVREMSPGRDEDKLPFSKAADVYAFGTIWYELQARDWPFKNQPAEPIIWQVGSGEGVKHLLTTISLGKEVTEILSACWSFDPCERTSFTQLMEMLEKLPKLNRRLSHPGHFWKSADINSSKIPPRFERIGLGILEQSSPKM
ncbi:kinase suppressor of Ras 1 isoform X3 [Protopterus annectens]|uniref:kinase suppressor of Ras 1 isoform X3 n=1 Tax=Protopterus annectens TaxID=7888 RepID=UPI001CFA6677|nr:kinase suppressor of Ras 1 isoform X3 [Protopterus annectens]